MKRRSDAYEGTCRAEVGGTSPRGKRGEGQAHTSPATPTFTSQTNILLERTHEPCDAMMSTIRVHEVCDHDKWSRDTPASRW
jgi:hypothetical protein